MRLLFSLGLLVFAFPTLLVAGDYVVTVNGTSREIELDQEVMLKLFDGTELRLILQQNEYLRFKGDLFAFEHDNSYKPNRVALDEGIFQTTLFTPLGTTVLVQEYLHIDPTSLVDLLLRELTKEEVEYGYKYREKKITRDVRGIALNGKQAITSYAGEEWTKNVLAHGWKDRGILVITLIEKDNHQADGHVLDRLWRSLRLVSHSK